MRESPPKVITIPAKPEVASRQAIQRQLRVAAYCRVSTDDEVAARGIYTNAGGLTTRDLADAEVVDAAALRMIVNALLIARYGCAVLDIHERGRKA